MIYTIKWPALDYIQELQANCPMKCIAYAYKSDKSDVLVI